ncbi:hypothetical protein BH11PLA2_BH11PLA2_19300 [soil metagenome]
MAFIWKKFRWKGFLGMSRLPPRYKWILRLVLAVVVSVVVRTIWLVGEREIDRSAGERALNETFVATEATDPEWQWDQLNANRRFPASDKNSAELISRIKSLMPSDWVHQINPKQWEPEHSPQSANKRISESTLTAVRRELTIANDAVVLARTLKDFPQGNRTITITPDVLSTPLQSTADTRVISRLLRWDALLAASDGKRELAADNLIAILNCSRSVGDEPFLVSQVVRIGARSIAACTLEEVLGKTELSEKSLAALQEAWLLDADVPLLLNGLRGERAAYDRMLKNLMDGTYTPGSNANQPKVDVSFEGYAWWLYRGRLPAERAYYHKYVSAGVAAARLPIHEQMSAITALPALPPAEMKMTCLLLPAVEKVANSYWRSVAEARCIVVALACERYRLKHGAWPRQLLDLPKELLQSIPVDPFNAQALRFLHLEEGIMIYSTGRDGANDGIAMSKGLQPVGPRESIRLWDISQRYTVE